MPITKYENQTFENMAFLLEECFFVNCVLKECDLFYSGGDADWTNVRWENCRWHFRGPALKTIQLLQVTGALPRQQPPPTVLASSSKMN
ncbi:MAG: hypothetical protein WCC27_11340 [Acidobacteriaceae bacterium]